jgi:hypothetical protein
VQATLSTNTSTATVQQTAASTAVTVEAGFTATRAILATAAASGNTNIAGAAAVLTTATDTGLNYDTEVLGALISHDSRITTLETSITTTASATTVAVAAEAALRIAGDASTLTSANSFTTSAVASEATLRSAADTALGARVTGEETARIAADTALGARVTAEETARKAADSALNTRIDGMNDKISSATATAIALGGSTILPDTSFTLSGNLGMYDGATALAVNAAGRVSEKVYITAAVGGGLNKGGKLGGRVGVVFGF